MYVQYLYKNATFMITQKKKNLSSAFASNWYVVEYAPRAAEIRDRKRASSSTFTSLLDTLLLQI